MKFRCLILGLLWVANCVSHAAESFERSVQPFLSKHCNSCHDAKKQKGDFRLDTLSRDFGKGADVAMWVEVMDRINSGEMPPENKPRPDAGEIERVVGWLGDRIKEGQRARMSRRAKVAHYRLSREEYSNTVHDLLGVHYDAKAPGRMTEDPMWHGFERIGSQLTLSPSHVEKYLKAARAILDAAYPDQAPVTRKFRKDALDIDWPNRLKRELLRERGRLDQVRVLLWPGHVLPHAEPAHIGYRMTPGIYHARMKLSGLKPPDGRPPHVKLHCKQLDRTLFEQDILAPEDEPVIVEFETYLEGKISVKIDNAVPGPSNAGRSGRPTGQYVFTKLGNPHSRAPWQRKMTDEEGNALYPFLIFDWIEWEGPIIDEESVKRRAAYFAIDESQTRECLTRFAEQAWRRPVTNEEISPYVVIVEKESVAGAEFRDAYKTGMLGVLASKNFYYLAEGSAAEQRDTLNDYELASRLSYFLWSSMPDEELFAAARAGKLKRPRNFAPSSIACSTIPGSRDSRIPFRANGWSWASSACFHRIRRSIRTTISGWNRAWHWRRRISSPRCLIRTCRFANSSIPTGPCSIRAWRGITGCRHCPRRAFNGWLSRLAIIAAGFSPTPPCFPSRPTVRAIVRCIAVCGCRKPYWARLRIHRRRMSIPSSRIRLMNPRRRFG